MLTCKTVLKSDREVYVVSATESESVAVPGMVDYARLTIRFIWQEGII